AVPIKSCLIGLTLPWVNHLPIGPTTFARAVCSEERLVVRRGWTIDIDTGPKPLPRAGADFNSSEANRQCLPRNGMARADSIGIVTFLGIVPAAVCLRWR